MGLWAVDSCPGWPPPAHVPRSSPADIAAVETVNVGGTREWLAWAERHHVNTFVHLSTIKAVVAGDGTTDEHAPACSV